MSSDTSLNQLPPEVLQLVFYCLDVLDILQIRKVSRYLNEISHSRPVWCNAYRKAEFIRPPGPFLSQSVRDLENALVPCFRTDRNLRRRDTAQTGRPALRPREIRYTGVHLGIRLVFGRLLFIAFKDGVRSYDLDVDESDHNSGPNIIYRMTGGILTSFHCVSAIDVEGHPFTCMVLSEAKRTTTQISIYLLHAVEESEVTLELLHEFEHITFAIEAVDLGPRVIVVQGRLGHDHNSPRHLVAMDVHTRTQFLFPLAELPEMMDYEQQVEALLPMTILTSTHILLARSFYTATTRWMTFFQAFSLPPADNFHSIPTPTSLILSHRGFLSGINVSSIVLLHDSILDSSTQDILIAIGFHVSEPSQPIFIVPFQQYSLRLSATHGSHDHHLEVGTVAFQRCDPLSYTNIHFLHPSFNGTGRVFYTRKTGSYSIVSVLEFDLRDNGSDSVILRQAKVMQYDAILRFLTPRSLLDYDPCFGRICLGYSTEDSRVIEIFNLGV